MEQAIVDTLQEDERVLWMGRPHNIKLMEAPYHVGITVRWAISLVLIALCFWYPETEAAMMQSEAFIRNFVLLLLAGAVILALYPSYVVWKIKRNTVYCVTNLRAIICIGSKPVTMKFRMLEDVDTDTITYDELSTGNGTVYIGEKTKLASKWSRAQSAAAENPAFENMPLMFYSIRQPDFVVECLRGGSREKMRKGA